MYKLSILLFISFALVFILGLTHHDGSVCSEHHSAAISSEENKVKETVKVDLYYECLCPDCMAEYPQLPPLVKKLGANINLLTYPYGNARMHTENGTTIVKCQHGEAECYGNKLHACAIDYLQHNVSIYIPYNNCLMKKRSNDAAADECGTSQNIASDPIKSCAKGDKGQDLLIYYGKESEKLKYPGVPYVLINGTPNEEDDLMQAVCEAFKNPPDACNNISNSSE